MSWQKDTRAQARIALGVAYCNLKKVLGPNDGPGAHFLLKLGRAYYNYEIPFKDLYAILDEARARMSAGGQGQIPADAFGSVEEAIFATYFASA